MMVLMFFEIEILLGKLEEIFGYYISSRISAIQHHFERWIAFENSSFFGLPRRDFLVIVSLLGFFSGLYSYEFLIY